MAWGLPLSPPGSIGARASYDPAPPPQPVHIHLHVKIDGLEEIRALVHSIARHVLIIEHRETQIMSDLSGLQSELAGFDEVERGVDTLVAWVANEIEHNKGDQGALDALVGELRDKRTHIASAVASVGSVEPAPEAVSPEPEPPAADTPSVPDGETPPES